MFATPRLAIEPLAAGHADELFAALDHPAVHRHLTAPDVTTLDALRARLARLAATAPPPGERWWNFAVRLAVTEAATDRRQPIADADAATSRIVLEHWAGAGVTGPVIGRLEATTYGSWGEIAYVFSPRWWRRGLATEATAWLIDHLADHGATELWAAVHPANTASQRLLLRLGFAAVDRPGRPLASYDPGDTVFVRRDEHASPPR